MKHQAESYRIIKGERYVCFCDLLSPEHERYVELAKSLKIKHRIYKHPDGFSRFFVLESETKRLSGQISPSKESA